MQKTDLDSLFSKADVSIKSSEHPDERALRLRNEKDDARVERWKGLITYAFVLFALAGVGGSCFYKIFIDTGATTETRHWSQTMLSSLIAGGASFVLGRTVGSK